MMKIQPSSRYFSTRKSFLLQRERKGVREFRRGERIFSQGEPAESVMYIQKGGVKVSVVNGAGKEAVVAMYGPGDFVGVGCMGGQPIRIGTATAITPSTILAIGNNEMLRVLHNEPRLSNHFIEYMLGRNIRMEADLVDQLFNPCEKRLARTLLLLASAGKQGPPADSVLPKVSQKTLAAMVGTHAFASELLHEEIHEARLHRMQWQDHNQENVAGSHVARARDRELRRRKASARKTVEQFRNARRERGFIHTAETRDGTYRTLDRRRCFAGVEARESMDGPLFGTPRVPELSAALTHLNRKRSNLNFVAALFRRNVVFETIVCANRALVRIGRIFHAVDHVRFERLPFFNELFHALRARILLTRKPLKVAGLPTGFIARSASRLLERSVKPVRP